MVPRRFRQTALNLHSSLHLSGRREDSTARAHRGDRGRGYALLAESTARSSGEGQEPQRSCSPGSRELLTLMLALP